MVTVLDAPTKGALSDQRRRFWGWSVHSKKRCRAPLAAAVHTCDCASAALVNGLSVPPVHGT